MAELVLDEAAKSGAITTPVIVRPGQIVGPLPEVDVGKGSGWNWSAKEVVPSLILSSSSIRVLPDSLREKDKLRWIPVNVCARIIAELAGHENTASRGGDVHADVYNITNIPLDQPEITWSQDMLPVIKRRLQNATQAGRAVDIVPLTEWVQRMEKHGATADNPAIRLPDFYEELAVSDPHAGLGADIETTKSRAASPSFRAMGPVKSEWMLHWMRGWGL
ncbi:hypothetical protein LTR36_000503 [Oleoguttula mirabilis]|uniref:Thioester reductase (TE) domain-containing protein n=1 Tax=Oleoguttula mirabilis TaxID=1507867 RepID=A0AAV9JPP2_9PEZI|nr:hypothetical protein LTR36_000503 [Oleoguttula mirabilis]